MELQTGNQNMNSSLPSHQEKKEGEDIKETINHYKQILKYDSVKNDHHYNELAKKTEITR